MRWCMYMTEQMRSNHAKDQEKSKAQQEDITCHKRKSSNGMRGNVIQLKAANSQQTIHHKTSETYI